MAHWIRLKKSTAESASQTHELSISRSLSIDGTFEAHSVTPQKRGERAERHLARFRGYARERAPWASFAASLAEI